MAICFSDFSFTTTKKENIGILKSTLESICGEYEIFQNFKESENGFRLDYYELNDAEFEGIFEEMLNLPEKFVVEKPHMDFNYDASFDVEGEMFYSMCSYNSGTFLGFKSIECEDYFCKGYVENGELIIKELDMDEYEALGGPFVG